MRKETYKEIYDIVDPLVEKMKAKYSADTNIDGYEPALTSDIVDIVIQVLNIYRREDTDAFREGVESAIETLQSKAKMLEL